MPACAVFLCLHLRGLARGASSRPKSPSHFAVYGENVPYPPTHRSSVQKFLYRNFQSWRVSALDMDFAPPATSSAFQTDWEASVTVCNMPNRVAAGKSSSGANLRELMLHQLKFKRVYRERLRWTGTSPEPRFRQKLPAGCNFTGFPHSF